MKDIVIFELTIDKDYEEYNKEKEFIKESGLPFREDKFGFSYLDYRLLYQALPGGAKPVAMAVDGHVIVTDGEVFGKEEIWEFLKAQV